MLGIEETTERVLSLWLGGMAHDVTEVLARLSTGVGGSFEPCVSVVFPSRHEGEPLELVARSGCVMLYGGGGIAVDMPEFMGFNRLVPNQWFYNKLYASLAHDVWQWGSSKRAEVAKLLAEFHQYLGLRDGLTSEVSCQGRDDLFFDVDTGPDPDAGVILAYLVRCVDEGICSPVGVTFWADWDKDDTDPPRPAFFTMTAVCPQNVPPEDRDNLRARNLGFCDRFEDYLEQYYYPTYPDQRVEVAELMRGLRTRLD